MYHQVAREQFTWTVKQFIWELHSLINYQKIKATHTFPLFPFPESKIAGPILKKSTWPSNDLGQIQGLCWIARKKSSKIPCLDFFQYCWCTNYRAVPELFKHSVYCCVSWFHCGLHCCHFRWQRKKNEVFSIERGKPSLDGVPKVIEVKQGACLNLGK